MNRDQRRARNREQRRGQEQRIEEGLGIEIRGGARNREQRRGQEQRIEKGLGIENRGGAKNREQRRGQEQKMINMDPESRIELRKVEEKNKQNLMKYSVFLYLVTHFLQSQDSFLHFSIYTYINQYLYIYLFIFLF